MLQIYHWAKYNIQQFIEKGYIGGYSDGTFKLNNSITRAEAVVTLERVILNTPIPSGQPWPENISGEESPNNVSSNKYIAKDGDWLYYW